MRIFIRFVLLFFLSQSSYASSIDVDNATIRLMPPNVQMTAGYFTLTNNFNDEQILVAAKSNFFGKIEIHLSKKDGDMMKMLKQDSVSISANTILEFKPMGYHLMLMILKITIQACLYSLNLLEIVCTLRPHDPSYAEGAIYRVTFEYEPFRRLKNDLLELVCKLIY